MSTDARAIDPAELVRMHPWLMLKAGKMDYLPPGYYDGILPDYNYHQRTDRSFLADFMIALGQPGPALEIGPGTGRCTSVLLNERPDIHGQLDLIDQSKIMLSACEARFGRDAFRHLYHKDAMSALHSIDSPYAVIVAMWSLSHAVHQHLRIIGDTELARATVKTIFKKMFCELLVPGGRFFIMHFDSLSDEQRISIAQRRRLYPFLSPGQQSPSWQMLCATLNALQGTGMVHYRMSHYAADRIVYRNLEHALEVFMNFHMETEFNSGAFTGQVIHELELDLKHYEQSDGTIAIAPAWYIFEGVRL